MHSNTHVYTVPHVLNWLWLFLRNTYDIKLPALAVGLQQLLLLEAMEFARHRNSTYSSACRSQSLIMLLIHMVLSNMEYDCSILCNYCKINKDNVMTSQLGQMENIQQQWYII